MTKSITSNKENSKEILHVPLKSLIKSSRNVRTMQSPLGGLPNSILANGLYMNLVVSKEIKGKKITGNYAVEAGSRRFEALNYLLEQGKITADYPVKVMVIDEADAKNASLVENFHREKMHPADEVIAFQDLINEGKSVEHIANVFGMSELHVKARLKLANASKEIFTEFKENRMTLEQLKTLCLTDDHAHQNSVWFNTTQEWNKTPARLREAIITDELPVTHKKVVFVGLENYLNAGGSTRIDLFTEEGKGDTILDIAILDTLVQKKLALEADKVQAEGWGWVEFAESTDYTYLQSFRKLHKAQRELNEDEIAQYEAIEQRQEKYDEAENVFQETDYDDEDEQQAVYDKLEAERMAIDAEEKALNEITYIWPENKNIAGVFISIGNNGELERKDGLLRASDVKVMVQDNQENGGGSESKAVQGNQLSNSFQQCLTAQRTGALQIAVANNSDKALVLLTHKLVLSSFTLYQHAWGKSAVTASQNTTSLHPFIQNYEESEVAQELQTISETWASILPTNADELLDWLLSQPQNVILGLLAYCTSKSIDVNSTQSNDHYQKLGVLFELDIRKTWKPTAENYFSRVSKSQMMDVVKETGCSLSVDVEKAKKGDLAKQVAEVIKDANWLPELLKIN